MSVTNRIQLDRKGYLGAFPGKGILQLVPTAARAMSSGRGGDVDVKEWESRGLSRS